MNYKYFKIENKEAKNGKKYGIITINVPPMNALSSTVLRELDAVLDQVNASDLAAFIFTGEGKAFIAGADISEMKNLKPAEAENFVSLGQKVFNKLSLSDKVSIAAVNGFALGGGLETALACDIRIFSDKATVGLPETSLGLIPGFGGTQRLTKLIGAGNASYVILTSNIITAEEALQLGIAQKVVASDDLLATAEKTISSILKNGPNAITAAKQMIKIAGETNLAEGQKQEARAFGKLFEQAEPKEGMSAFLEKRKPQF